MEGNEKNNSSDNADVSVGSRESLPNGWLRSGHVLCVLIGIAFVAIYGLRSYQFDAWQSYFFRDTIKFGQSCFAATEGTGSETFPQQLLTKSTQQLTIPHGFDYVPKSLGKAPFYHLRVVCKVSDFDLEGTKGVPYLHTGWVFADYTEVYINGRRRIGFSGTDKPAIPLSSEDLVSDVFELEVRMSSKARSRMGLSGLTPLAIGPDTTSNFRIFGLETAMQNITVLYAVLPLLTLGLVLVFGWVYGVRSRLIATTFLFFGMSLVANSFALFADFLPWDFNTSYRLAKPFQITGWLMIIPFCLELLHTHGKLSERIIKFGAITLGIELAIISFSSDPSAFVLPLVQTYRYGCMAGGIAVIFLAWREIRNTDAIDFRRRNTYVMGFAGLFVCMLAADTIIELLRLPIFIKHYMDLFTPLFVGGLLLYSIGLVEKTLRKERTIRAKIEQDLALAHEIQDSLAPPPNYLHKAGVKINTYQIKHSAVAGDWMAFRELPSGEHIIVVADATGKGVQAALIVHAVQSLWADALQDESFDPGKWMTRVNRTLYTLGERKPHSMTMGIVVISGSTITYYCAGHVPLFVLSEAEDRPRVKSLFSRGSVLGLSAEPVITPAKMPIPENLSLKLLLGTDGVFEKGSRTNQRQVLSVVNLIDTRGAEGLNDCPEIDDKTLVIAETGNFEAA